MGSFVVQLNMYMAYLWGSSKFGESFSTIVQVAEEEGSGTLDQVGI